MGLSKMKKLFSCMAYEKSTQMIDKRRIVIQSALIEAYSWVSAVETFKGNGGGRYGTRFIFGKAIDCYTVHGYPIFVEEIGDSING